MLLSKADGRKKQFRKVRLVELIPDGHAIRNSIELAGRKGPDQREPEYRSLVHGTSLEIARADPDPIAEDEFCWNWR